MKRRGLFSAILGLGFAGGASAAMPRPVLPPEEVEVQDAWSQDPDAQAGLQEVQYRGGRRRRCWYETRQIRFRDRWGRWQFRTVRRQVCNF